MGAAIYGKLQSFGFTHPLHPLFVHLPIGLTVGALLFLIAAAVTRRSPLCQTARHCLILAALTTPLAAVGGVMDWRHFYAGAWMWPFVVKMVLALLLVGALVAAAVRSCRHKDMPGKLLPIYLVCVVLIAGLGFIGGELVYGRKQTPATPAAPLAPAPPPAVHEAEPHGAQHAPPPAVPAPTDHHKPAGHGPAHHAPPAPAASHEVAAHAPGQHAAQSTPDHRLVAQGSELFARMCAFCHLTDSSEAKMGPGLKGILKRPTLPASHHPANAETVRTQILKPYKDMPAFDSLSEKELDALVAYMKTL